MGVIKDIQNYSKAPISRHVMLEIVKNYKRPNDKISDLIKQGYLISLKRGVYIPGAKSDSPAPDPFLIANHLWGPSYVSLETALSYWGMIPERTYEISSVTSKTAKKYKTPIGRFSYQKLSLPYYFYGTMSVEISLNQRILIASPEKALLDKVVLTPSINLRSIKQTKNFLIEDLRMEEADLRAFDLDKMNSWLVAAPKKASLTMLTKSLKEL